MIQADVFDDGEAEARTTELTGPGLVDSIEAFEDPVEMAW